MQRSPQAKCQCHSASAHQRHSTGIVWGPQPARRGCSPKAQPTEPARVNQARRRHGRQECRWCVRVGNKCKTVGGRCAAGVSNKGAACRQRRWWTCGSKVLAAWWAGPRRVVPSAKERHIGGSGKGVSGVENGCASPCAGTAAGVAQRATARGVSRR